MATIDSKIPEGALAEKWTTYKAHQKHGYPGSSPIRRRVSLYRG